MFLKFGSLDFLSLKFLRIAEERDQISRTVPSLIKHVIRERPHTIFSLKLDWGSLRKKSKEWIKDPKNMALFVWVVGVAVSGLFLFLVMTGMLNDAFKSTSERDAWTEVNNQILNALFTLLCLYYHPEVIYHLVLTLRWRPQDITILRPVYCKNGMYKPHEWAHILVVILLLHLYSFAQYASCALYLGYLKYQRPAIGIWITHAVTIAAPAIAGVYCIVSPLGKDYDYEVDEESQVHNITTPEGSQTINQLRGESLQKRFSFARRDERTVESSPIWSGGVLHFWDDISVACLSLFCSLCVFGWNVERLGFGNMYVHIATFLLFCVAPFGIFIFAAINVSKETVSDALWVAGIILSVFGLLYGGFWRIQMRKRFNLPPYNLCCGKQDVADCTLWLFCCCCSLAQEVRTVNSYDIVKDKSCVMQVDERGESPISPLPCEDGDFQFMPEPSSPRGPRGNSSSPSEEIMEAKSPDGHLALVEEESPTRGKDQTMTPPAPSCIQRDAS